VAKIGGMLRAVVGAKVKRKEGFAADLDTKAETLEIALELIDEAVGNLALLGILVQLPQTFRTHRRSSRNTGDIEVTSARTSLRVRVIAACMINLQNAGPLRRQK
jgi:hypothetical protein